MIVRLCVVLGLALNMCAELLAGTPVGSALTYQGVLKQDGAPANGAYHLRFQLWDALVGGTQVGADVDEPSLAVNEGVFTASLDFGALAFNGDARWLQVQVITNGGSTVTTLVPRQPVQPAPYALYATRVDGPNVTNLNASNLASGSVPDAQLNGTYSAALALTNTANTFAGSFTGMFAGSGAAVTDLNATNIASGTLSASRLPSGGSWPLTSVLNLDANTFVVDAANNRVGIGTATPSAPLHLVAPNSGLTPGEGIRIQGTQSTVANQAYLSFANGAGTAIGYVGDGGDGDNNMYLGEYGADIGLVNSTFGPALIAKASGNVGMGTSSPAVALHVQRLGPVLALQDTASNANQAGYVGFWNNSGTETGWVGYGTPGSPHMTVLNNRSTGHINLLPNANVGIGTTTPLAKLDVRGDIRMGPTGSLRVTSSAESLRIVRGLINPSGSIAHGTGFTVSHPSTGRYIITFSPAFFTTPTVTATARTPVNARYDNLASGSVEIVLFDGGGLVDQSFCFLAIGPN